MQLQHLVEVLPQYDNRQPVEVHNHIHGGSGASFIVKVVAVVGVAALSVVVLALISMTPVSQVVSTVESKAAAAELPTELPNFENFTQWWHSDKVPEPAVAESKGGDDAS